MRCRTARHLMDLQFDGELDETQLPLLMGHLEGCPRCAAEHRRLAHQEALLRRVLPRPEPTQTEIERGVARVAGILGQPGAARLARRWWPRRAFAATCVLAASVILGLLLWLPRFPGSPRAVQVADTGGVVLSRDRRWIAFVEADGLYVRRLPTGARTRVAPGECSTPTWAPDGTRIAFLRDEGRAQRLAVVDVATQRERPLVSSQEGETLEDPQWAPRGNWILLVRAQSRSPRGRAALWLVDAGGAPSKKVDDLGPLPKRLHSWAPDARHFAFVRWGEKQGAEYAIGLPDGKPRRLANLGGVEEPQIAWAPDGQRLIYLSGEGRPETGALWLAELGRPVRRITHPGANRDAAWSPSGKWICYAEAHGQRFGATEGRKVGLRLSDTLTPPSALTYVSGRDLHQRPVWSPDGQHIAYEQTSASGHQLVYAIAISEGKPMVISTRGTDERLVGWDAAGTRLLVERRSFPSGGTEGRSTWLEQMM